MATRKTSQVGWQARMVGLSALAGAIGAVVRLVYYMGSSALAGQSPWAVPNLAGSLLTGHAPLSYHAGTFVSGVLLHLLAGAAWGVVLGLALAYLMPGALRTPGAAVAVGLAFGGFTYMWDVAGGMMLNLPITAVHTLVGTVNVFVGHLLYGLITALLLYAWRRRPGLSVMFAPKMAARERTPR